MSVKKTNNRPGISWINTDLKDSESVLIREIRGVFPQNCDKRDARLRHRMRLDSGTRMRPFVQSDLDQLHRMIQETIEKSYGHVYPPRAIRFFKNFHRELKIAERTRTGCVLILEKNGAILATGSLVGNEILGVFVAPEAQGRGYGRAIMNELESNARSKGIFEIHLSISLPSRRFYESMGYEVLEKESADVGEGQRLEFWPARKKLDETASPGKFL